MLQSLVRKLQKLNWPIRYKLGLAFTLVLICFLINGVNSVVLLNNIKQNQVQKTTIATCLDQVQRLNLTYTNQLNAYGDAVFLVKSTYFNNSTADNIFKIQNEIRNGEASTRDYNRAFNADFARLYNI